MSELNSLLYFCQQFGSSFLAVGFIEMFILCT